MSSLQTWPNRLKSYLNVFWPSEPVEEHVLLPRSTAGHDKTFEIKDEFVSNCLSVLNESLFHEFAWNLWTTIAPILAQISKPSRHVYYVTWQHPITDCQWRHYPRNETSDTHKDQIGNDVQNQINVLIRQTLITQSIIAILLLLLLLIVIITTVCCFPLGFQTAGIL